MYFEISDGERVGAVCVAKTRDRGLRRDVVDHESLEPGRQEWERCGVGDVEIFIEIRESIIMKRQGLSVDEEAVSRVHLREGMTTTIARPIPGACRLGSVS